MTAQKPVVVITGASSGIGRATAIRFARQGARVVLASRRQEELGIVAAECRSRGGHAIVHAVDTTDQEAVRRLADDAVAQFGRIDVWVNAAAVSAFGRFLDLPEADFRRVIDVDLMGYVHGTRAALDVMERQGQGVVINVSSILGEVPQPYSTPYVMAKAGVLALGISLRQELSLRRLKRIHVVSVLPPTIDTPFFDNAANYSGRRARAMPPVYSAKTVAKAIVGSARSPRGDVIVSRAGKALVAAHRRAPGPVEAQMKALTEKRQLSPTQEQRPTTGTIFEPSRAPGSAQISGGWISARRRQKLRAAGWTAAALSAVLVWRSARSRRDP